MTTLTLKNEHGEYTVSQIDDSVHLVTIFTDLIIPVLLAAQYQRETIYQVMRELGKSGE